MYLIPGLTQYTVLAPYGQLKMARGEKRGDGEVERRYVWSCLSLNMPSL